MNLTKITDNGGSFEKINLTEAKFQELVSKRENHSSSFHLDEQLLAKFNQLINSTDRKIIVVVSPYHQSFFKKFKNIEIANEYLYNLNTRDNIEVFDLRSYITDDKLFLNTSHLNYKGAKKFTKKLKQLLSSKYEFSPLFN